MSGSYYTLDAKYNTLLALIQQNASLITTDNIEDVLTAGNDAGGLSITNLNDVALTTINSAAYPPVVAADTLTAVLTAGNDAGGLSITNLNDVALTTINNAAYPPPPTLGLVSSLPITLITTTAAAFNFTSLYSVSATIVSGAYYRLEAALCRYNNSGGTLTLDYLLVSTVLNPSTSLNNLALSFQSSLVRTNNQNFTTQGAIVATAAQMGGVGTRTFYLDFFSNGTSTEQLIPGAPTGYATFPPTFTITRIA